MAAHTYPSPTLLGSRKSDLALIQARYVMAQIEKLPDAPKIEIQTGTAAGDKDKITPFLELSKQTGGSDLGKSLWTNELEADLVAGKVHFLVHSLKDMPTTLPPNCLLGAITEREDPSDAVVMPKGSKYTSIDELPAGSVVGSSSSRRRALIRKNWPHLEVEECRGNVDTRLAKLDAADSKFSCILLATAGLLRLGLGHRVTQRLQANVFPYAVGQAALGIEVTADSPAMQQLVLAADHKPSRWRCMAERAMLRTLQGGCSSPIGVYTHYESPENGGKLCLGATVVDMAGDKHVSTEELRLVESDEDAEALGLTVAKKLLDGGASGLLQRHA
ncbi:hypothetical protein VHEMI02174 [[Torrubiella] hemipterigena]|uniref:hydroxymethylbilane synthase n=1 Tax=[Torrubiella] hemipterigena TaxID=1531966 RepID=A0A0A1T9Q0_9HYPO|nr:hypothetical protein VHEMI02174 [[Torrubiella] hemipterigena]